MRWQVLAVDGHITRGDVPFTVTGPERVELLIDLFGYLSIIVHGLTILAQSMALGGVLFLVLLARPLARTARHRRARASRRHGAHRRLERHRAAGCREAATVALQAAVLIGTVDLSVSRRPGRRTSPSPAW